MLNNSFFKIIYDRFISENLGGYVGASLGGFTYDKIGFENGTTVVVALQVFAVFKANQNA